MTAAVVPFRARHLDHQAVAPRRWWRPRLPGWLACWFRGHDPRRALPGGFRCSRCRAAGADLSAFGFEGGGYVDLTRTTAWSRGDRG